MNEGRCAITLMLHQLKMSVRHSLIYIPKAARICEMLGCSAIIELFPCDVGLPGAQRLFGQGLQFMAQLSHVIRDAAVEESQYWVILFEWGSGIFENL